MHNPDAIPFHPIEHSTRWNDNLSVGQLGELRNFSLTLWECIESVHRFLNLRYDHLGCLKALQSNVGPYLSELFQGPHSHGLRPSPEGCPQNLEMQGSCRWKPIHPEGARVPHQ